MTSGSWGARRSCRAEPWSVLERPPGVNQMMRLTLYSRVDCHLCHEMRAIVDRVVRQVAATVEEIDVDGDPALVARYGDEVPVLLVNGARAFAGHVTEAALRARLAREPG